MFKNRLDEVPARVYYTEASKSYRTFNDETDEQHATQLPSPFLSAFPQQHENCLPINNTTRI